MYLPVERPYTTSFSLSSSKSDTNFSATKFSVLLHCKHIGCSLLCFERHGLGEGLSCWHLSCVSSPPLLYHNSGLLDILLFCFQTRISDLTRVQVSRYKHTDVSCFYLQLMMKLLIIFVEIRNSG